MKRWWALVALVAALTVLAGCGSSPGTSPGQGAAAAQPGKVVNLSPAEVQKRVESGDKVTILDVREDWEFKEGHIPGAKLIPLGTLPDRLKELNSAQPVIVVCRSGNRSAQGSQILTKAGFQQVFNMSGGMLQWKGQVEK